MAGRFRVTVQKSADFPRGPTFLESRSCERTSRSPPFVHSSQIQFAAEKTRSLLKPPLHHGPDHPWVILEWISAPLSVRPSHSAPNRNAEVAIVFPHMFHFVKWVDRYKWDSMSQLSDANFVAEERKFLQEKGNPPRYHVYLTTHPNLQPDYMAFFHDAFFMHPRVRPDDILGTYREPLPALDSDEMITWDKPAPELERMFACSNSLLYMMQFVAITVDRVCKDAKDLDPGAIQNYLAESDFDAVVGPSADWITSWVRQFQPLTYWGAKPMNKDFS